MKNISKNYYLIVFLTLLLILKIYFIFIYPRELIFFSTGLSKFNFYNTLSFSLDMQAFRDANHPGTPIYFIGYLIMKLTGNDVKSFYEYYYFHHFIILLFNFLSVGIFFNYFKKFISNQEIFSLLLIFISTYNYLFSLEIVSLISYQLGISLILYTYFLKSLEKDKLFKLSVICALSLSFKMTFLPYVLSIFITKYLFISQKINPIKRFFRFNFYFVISYLIFNFPIIGRIPKIFIDVLFVREDTSLSILNLIISLKTSLNELILNNMIFFVLLLIFLTIFMSNLIFFLKKFKQNKISNKLFSIFLFNIFITFFYIYTFLNAGQVFGSDLRINNLEKENFFRNNFPYLIFIISNYFLLTKLVILNDNLIKKILIFLSLLTFIIGFKNYNVFRAELINDRFDRQTKLISETEKYIDLNKDVLAYFTYSLGYGFGEEIFHLSGNSLEGNEYFTKEVVNMYPNFRYFRMNDIIHEINKKNNKPKSKINFFKDRLKKFDVVLKENFPKEIYEILSYNTKNSSINPLIARKKDIYSFYKDDNYKKPKAILYSHPKINKENFIKEEELFKFLEKEINIEKKVSFKIKDDDWFMYLIK